MRIAAIDDSKWVSTPSHVHIELEQRTDGSRAVASVMLALPFVALSGLVVSVASQSVLSDPEGLAVLAARPLASLGLVGATLVTGLLAYFPLSTAFARFGRRQSVRLTGDEVHVREHSPLGDRHWRAPLASFVGVAHRIRSSLSGVRHEIILVHGDPQRSILLAIQPRVTLADLEHMAALVRCPVILSDALPAAPPANLAADPVSDYRPMAA